MRYLHSIEKTVDTICKKYKRGSTIEARIGMRTNGDLHLGNLLPIIASVLIGEKLIARGYKYKLIIILVDQEINGNNLPFNKSPYSKNFSLAQHSIKKIRKFVSELDPENIAFDIKFKIVSKTQQTKKFRKLLKIATGKSRNDIPIFTICPRCGGLLKKYSGNYFCLIYYCKHCRNNFKLNITDPESFILLDHDLLGAIENNIFNIDLHILGADHAIKNNGTSSLKKREQFQNMLNNNSDHTTLLTPAIYFNNKKMSKSDSCGIFLEDIKKYYDRNYIDILKKFVNHNGSKKRLTINNISDIRK